MYVKKLNARMVLYLINFYKKLDITVEKQNARMVKLVDTLDLKSSEQQCSCGFKSRSEYLVKP